MEAVVKSVTMSVADLVQRLRKTSGDEYALAVAELQIQSARAVRSKNNIFLGELMSLAREDSIIGKLAKDILKEHEIVTTKSEPQKIATNKKPAKKTKAETSSALATSSFPEQKNFTPKEDKDYSPGIEPKISVFAVANSFARKDYEKMACRLVALGEEGIKISIRALIQVYIEPDYNKNKIVISRLSTFIAANINLASNYFLNLLKNTENQEMHNLLSSLFDGLNAENLSKVFYNIKNKPGHSQNYIKTLIRKKGFAERVKRIPIEILSCLEENFIDSEDSNLVSREEFLDFLTKPKD